MTTVFGGPGLEASIAGGSFPSVTGYRGYGSYANPHHTIALRDIPTNIKQIFRLVRFYYNQDAILGAIIDKMAEYPITELVITEQSGEPLTAAVYQKWDYLLNIVLNVRQIMININTDKIIYGNSFHYIYYPFVRYCVCKTCNAAYPISSLDDIKVHVIANDASFALEVTSYCSKCSATRLFRVEDRKSEAKNNARIVRLSPLRMELEYNPASGAKQWYWTPPSRLRDGLLHAERTVIDTTEMKILEAVYKDRRIRLRPSRIWVVQTPSQPDLWEGWGVPPVFRVLEDVYYYKILKRANEALAQEHITPARFISPGVTSDVSPQRTLYLSDWQQKIRAELYRYKQDPNHIVVTPIPITVEQMGGQGRVLMVSPEIESAARIIASGLGCPIELVWGGLNWSGASVSLRVLENHFLNMREDSERLLDFLIPKLANYYRLPAVNVRLADFKMADDIQQQTTAVNLMLQGFLDRRNVLNSMGYNADEVLENLEREHERLNTITMKDNIAASHMNTVIAALEAKANVLLQFELQHFQSRVQAQAEREHLRDLNDHVQHIHSLGYATPLEFEQSAQLLQSMDPNLAGMILQQWQKTMPNVTALLIQRLNINRAQAALAESAAQRAEGAQDFGAAATTQNVAAAGPYNTAARVAKSGRQPTSGSLGQDNAAQIGDMPGVPEAPEAPEAPGASVGDGQSSVITISGQNSSIRPLPEQRPPRRSVSSI